MSNLRKHALPLVFLFLCGSASAIAAPVMCPAAALSTYDKPGFTCTETINGVDFIFKSFTFQGPPESGLSDSQINVAPVEGQNVIGLQFLGNFTAQGSIQTYMINYIIDPPPPIIRGEQIDVDPATLQTTLCPALNALPACPPGTPLVLMATTANPTASVTFANPVNALGLQNKFIVDGSTGSASAGGFDNRTLLLSGAVPEPAPLALTAFGLLGLLAFRSRAKFRQILLELRF